MRSLFARFFTSQLVVVLIALMALGFSLSYMYTQYIFSLKENDLIQIGRRLADEFSRSPSASFSINRVRALVEAAHIYGDAGIWVIDAEGLVLVSSSPGQQIQGLRLDAADVSQILSGGIVGRRVFPGQLSEPAFAVAVPINTRLGVVGAVILSAPLRGIMRTVKGGQQLIFWSGVLAALLAALASFLLARRVVGPLQQMRAVALDMARGDFRRRVELPGRADEVAELATALNQLASRLDTTLRALSEEKSKIDACIAGLAEGVLALDRDQCVLLANAAATQLIGPAIVTVGAQLASPAQENTLVPRLAAACAQVMQEGTPQQFGVDHAGRSVLVHVTPVPGPAGSLLGAVALLQDVSERQKLEKMRRDFVADVSHELRTPLTSIYGFAQAIMEGVASNAGQVQRYLGVIMDESLRLIRLTNRLIDLSRIESQHVKLHLSHVSVADVLTDTITSLERQLAEKGIAIEAQLAPELPLVEADSDRLEQVLMNLLDNATRHTPSNGKIVVAAELALPAATHVQVSVADSGPGIPEHELPFIWERFYKVDKARRQNRGGGTGLGLVIVKELVELHNGTVRAENLPTGGTRFAFTIPVASSPLPECGG